MKKITRQILFFVAVLLLVCFIGGYFIVQKYYSTTVLSELFSNQNAFISYFSNLGPYKRVWFIFVVVLVEVIFGFIPGALVYPPIGAVLGGWTGFGIVVFGNVVGSVANYFIGYFLGKSYESLRGEKLEIAQKLRGSGPFSVFFLRLNPLTSFDFIPYVAGFIKMNFFWFIIANTIGLLPLIFVSVMFGDQLLVEGSYMLKLFAVGMIVYIGWKAYQMFKK